jgi:hypothetical protein
MRGSERRPRTLALGIWLATRTGLARIGLWLAAGTAIATAILAQGHVGALASRFPTLAAMGVAWSAGISVAFGGALRALRRDLDQGVVALARLRGVGLLAYVRGRVWGLTALIALAVGAATLGVGFTTIVDSKDRLAATREAFAALTYALAFAATLGPLAMAALGTGNRLVGYLSLLAVLALPEVLAGWTEPRLPAGWHELTSIPSALSAVAAGVRSGGPSLLHMVRAMAGLAAIIALSLAAVWARLAQAEAGAQP